MSLDSRNLMRFQTELEENPRYWARFGGKPILAGCTVLEVGCGRGALCVDCAESGAVHVVGIDLDSDRIRFACENIKLNYPHLESVIEFRDVNLHDYSEQPILDYVVSKNTFEHIMDLERVLESIKKRLKPGGKLYAGFGPLYNAPGGDHGLTRTGKWGPWGHLLLDEEKMIARLNELRNEPIDSLYDLGLNKLCFADYERLFRESGMEICSFEVNKVGRASVMRRFAGSVFSLLRKFPSLKEYFTFNIYCVLRKASE